MNMKQMLFCLSVPCYGQDASAHLAVQSNVGRLNKTISATFVCQQEEIHSVDDERVSSFHSLCIYAPFTPCGDVGGYFERPPSTLDKDTCIGSGWLRNVRSMWVLGHKLISALNSS
jgi:hypothetical protein